MGMITVMTTTLAWLEPWYTVLFVKRCVWAMYKYEVVYSHIEDGMSASPSRIAEKLATKNYDSKGITAHIWYLIRNLKWIELRDGRWYKIREEAQ